MIDLHSHILPNIDDGAESISEALEMLRDAQSSGVRKIVATPHYNPMYDWLNRNSPALNSLYHKLCEEATAQDIHIEISLGMEIRAFDEMTVMLERNELLPFGNTRYVLVEFDNWESERWCKKILGSLLQSDFIPVIAHPERYEFVWDKPWNVYDWLEMGCEIQITKASMLGRFGREAKLASDDFLERGWVSCVASDAHGFQHRTAELKSAFTYLSENYSVNLAEMLLRENPSRILEGKPLRKG